MTAPRTPRAPKAKTPAVGNRAGRRAAEKRYVRSRRVYVLNFEAPDLADLEIRARSVPLGRFLQLAKLAAGLNDVDESGQGFTAEHADAFTELFEGFADALVSWNLDDRSDDEIVEVPATLDGVMSQDTDFMMTVIDAWLTAVGGVEGPLGGTSTSGVPSPAVPIPMVAPSPSPSS